jgi:glycosyltransferase involved in cell wall biosynthesis
MKIAHLIAQFYPVLGGAEVCVHNICENLGRNGHEAVVIATTPPPEKMPEISYQREYLSPRTCGLLRKIPWLGKFYLCHELKKLQKKHHFDLWQVTMGYPLGCYSADFFCKAGIPAVLRCCGQDIQVLPEVNYGYRLEPELDKLVRSTYSKFSGYVANSQSMKDEYLALGIEDKRIEIIPNGVNLEMFEGRAPDPELRRKFCGDKDLPLILTVGRYNVKKGFNLIPSIARHLKESGLEFVWLIAGRQNSKILQDDPEAEKLGIRILEDTGGGKTEDFKLPSEELVKIYRSADIFAFPSFIEGLPTVCVEALAAGLPVVSTDAPGVRDIIRDGINGIQVKTGDTEAFAEALSDLLRDHERAEKLSKEAVKSVAENSWSNIAERYGDFYQKVIAGDYD